MICLLLMYLTFSLRKLWNCYLCHSKHYVWGEYTHTSDKPGGTKWYISQKRKLKELYKIFLTRLLSCIDLKIENTAGWIHTFYNFMERIIFLKNYFHSILWWNRPFQFEILPSIVPKNVPKIFRWHIRNLFLPFFMYKDGDEKESEPAVSWMFFLLAVLAVLETGVRRRELFFLMTSNFIQDNGLTFPKKSSAFSRRLFSKLKEAKWKIANWIYLGQLIPKEEETSPRKKVFVRSAFPP